MMKEWNDERMEFLKGLECGLQLEVRKVKKKKLPEKHVKDKSSGTPSTMERKLQLKSEKVIHLEVQM